MDARCKQRKEKLMSKSAIVTGAGGMIGHALVKRLKQDGYSVLGIDRKEPEFEKTAADEFEITDLRFRMGFWQQMFRPGDEVFALAAEMGGASYVFTGDNDAEIMANSAMINLNTLEACAKAKVKKVFFASSACIYPDFIQMNPDACELREASAWPARPDSSYGLEKLFAEKLYDAYARNRGLDIRIARLHNVFSPFCPWRGGREKAPAAICRKVAEAESGGTVEVFGDGTQTRSFLYVDECTDGIRRLMESDFAGPVNLGSSEMISIDQLVRLTADIAGKGISIKHIPGPLGVAGRTSNNDLIAEKLGWAPSRPLREGLEKTYRWVLQQVVHQQLCDVTKAAFGGEKMKA
jgi:GDP-D-mannose 3', 5'-epimerase